MRAADVIVHEEIAAAGLDGEVWQGFAVLADIRSVGVMGDERTHARPVIVRAVTSEDAMTADWVRLAREWLDRSSDDLALGILHANVRFMDEILFELRTGVRTREQLRGIANRKYGFSWQSRSQVGDRLCWIRSAGYVIAPDREKRRITRTGLEFLEHVDLHRPS